jgi:hypothetical protein
MASDGKTFMLRGEGTARLNSVEKADPLRIALAIDPELPVPPLYYGGIERIVDMLACGFAARKRREST